MTYPATLPDGSVLDVIEYGTMRTFPDGSAEVTEVGLKGEIRARGVDRQGRETLVLWDGRIIPPGGWRPVLLCRAGCAFERPRWDEDNVPFCPGCGRELFYGRRILTP